MGYSTIAHMHVYPLDRCSGRNLQGLGDARARESQDYDTALNTHDHDGPWVIYGLNILPYLNIMEIQVERKMEH